MFVSAAGELIGLDLLGTQSELGVPTEMELLDAAIDQLTDEQVAAAADDGEAPDDLEAATAAPLDADESDSGDSDGTVRSPPNSCPAHTAY